MYTCFHLKDTHEHSWQDLFCSILSYFMHSVIHQWWWSQLTLAEQQEDFFLFPEEVWGSTNGLVTKWLSEYEIPENENKLHKTIFLWKRNTIKGALWSFSSKQTVCVRTHMCILVILHWNKADLKCKGPSVTTHSTIRIWKQIRTHFVIFSTPNCWESFCRPNLIKYSHSGDTWVFAQLVTFTWREPLPPSPSCEQNINSLGATTSGLCKLETMYAPTNLHIQVLPPCFSIGPSKTQQKSLTLL